MQLLQLSLRMVMVKDVGPLDRYTISGEDTLNSKKWHQIAVVSHEFDSTEVFLDGELSENITTSGSGTSLQLASGATGKIGANLTENTNFYLHGKLDELKMWNRALTQEEIANNYVPHSQSEFVLDFQFENESTMDDSKYGNHAINYGATATEDRFGKLNAALYFDGINDYLEIPTDPSYQLTEFPFSVSVWVYLEDSSSSNNRVFRNGTGGTDYGGVMIDVVRITAASYGDGFGRGPGDRKTFRSDDTLFSKKWHQIVVVSHKFDSTEIFLDGKLNENITTDGTGESLQMASGATGKIGANLTQNTKYYLHGKLDELKMWKGALTQGEVKAMYRPYEGPVLYVPKFFDNDNTQIYPNPTSNTVNLVGVNNGASVEVLNLQGEHVLDTEVVNGMVDLSILKSDLYMVYSKFKCDNFQ